MASIATNLGLRAKENVFIFRRNRVCLGQPPYDPTTSTEAAVNLSQILSSHASCSGFIKTERKQVTVPDSTPFVSQPTG
jgi:hypothetical protein